jgi:hypothetical protein
VCAPQLCLASKWTPSFVATYRPPVNGWTIREMPEEHFPENVRAAWHVRQPTQNQNWTHAVIEMARFGEKNGVPITKEIVAAIRNEADAEWCEDEPGRCTKKIKRARAATPRAPTVAEVRMVGIHRVMKSTSPVNTRPRCGCCGGR